MRGTHRAIVVVCLFLLGWMAGCAPRIPTRPAVSSQAPGTLPKTADGIAFIRGGEAFVIRGGAEREVLTDGSKKVAVSYSADRKNLLVAEELGVRRVVVLVPVDRQGPTSVVLDSDAGSSLGTVRVAGSPELVYFSVYGDSASRLSVSGIAKGSDVSAVPLGNAFSGEFDVDVAGDSLVYTGSGQNPATLILRTGSSERLLVAGLATAFTPAFSRDGARICFTGGERAGSEISVWVVDTDSDKPRVIAGTSSLTPASPVFSPAGDRIAVRGGEDGAIWVVPVAGGRPQRLDVNCDDAPIAW